MQDQNFGSTQRIDGEVLEEAKIANENSIMYSNLVSNQTFQSKQMSESKMKREFSSSAQPYYSTERIPSSSDSLPVHKLNAIQDSRNEIYLRENTSSKES